MADAWGFNEDELPTPEQIVGWIPGLVIETAVVLRINDMFSGADDPRANARVMPMWSLSGLGK